MESVEMNREKVLAALSRALDPRGLRLHELVASLNADAKGRHRVRTLLAELVDEGTIEKAEGARYRLVGWVPSPGPPGTPGRPTTTPEKVGARGEKREVPAGTVAGVIRVHPAGYGFVEREDGEGDVFVAARNRGAALDGDRVALATWMGYKGTEGRVADVLARGRARLTGVVRTTGRVAWLEPDDPRIQGHVSLDGGAGDAREGQAVVAAIEVYPTQLDAPLTARVEKVLGDPDDPRTEVAKVIACAEIPDEFPDEVSRAAAHTAVEVGPQDLTDRVDLRDRTFLTIDPETARDFDDAVCVEDGPRGTDRLWVAVADVSHYVRQHSALDREAQIRGVSVYLPNRAIPMLPHELSSGICSLNPEVDRLSMVARLDIDAGGKVVNTYFCAAVIRSRARLDYPGVAAALAGDLRGPRARYREFLPHLVRLDALARRMRKVRSERGSLDFDLPEAVVVLDEDDPRRVRDVRKSRAVPEIKDAYRLVEDCMLAANEAVARYFAERDLDTMWRVHDVPKLERLEEFASLAESFGVAFSAEDGKSPKKLRDFLATLAGKPMERALSYLLLRTLKQAVYDTVNVGHFGLASAAYLHFTSPIRRYPDLMVHRLLKRALRGDGMPAGGGEAYAGPAAPPRAEIQRLASESSANERRAMEAEREVVDMYRAFLMRDRIGEEYDGTVVGVTAFSLFIEIAEPFVEGRIRLEALGGGGWEYDERTVRLVQRETGKSFALGDAVRVRIENVSVQRRKIDVALVGHEAVSPRGERPARRRGEGTKAHGERKERGAVPGHGRERKGPPENKRGERKAHEAKSKRGPERGSRKEREGGRRRRSDD